MLQDGGHALVSARTIRWLVSTSKPNGRIQAQPSFGRFFQVDDAVEANLFLKEATINPKRKEEEEEIYWTKWQCLTLTVPILMMQLTISCGCIQERYTCPMPCLLNIGWWWFGFLTKQQQRTSDHQFLDPMKWGAILDIDFLGSASGIYKLAMERMRERM